MFHKKESKPRKEGGGEEIQEIEGPPHELKGIPKRVTYRDSLWGKKKLSNSCKTNLEGSQDKLAQEHRGLHEGHHQ